MNIRGDNASQKKYWFSSDWHFGHANIIKYCNRPFSSVEEMDQVLLDNINKNVAEGDVLYFLGDFCFARKQYYEVVKKYRNKINCNNVVWILGNHDKKMKQEYKTECLLTKCYFNGVYESHLAEIGKHKIYMHHYQHVDWPEKNKGCIHLWGHSHGMAISNSKNRTIDIGVDNIWGYLGDEPLKENYRPLELSEILTIMNIGTNDAEND